MNNLRSSFIIIFLSVIITPALSIGQTAQEQQAYSYAQQLYQDGLYEIAIEQYRQYLTNFPRGEQRPDAALQIGRAYYELGEYEQALKSFLQVDLDFPGSDEALDGLWAAGETYEAMGQFEEAARAFNRLYIYYPDASQAPRALIRGGEDAQKAGNFELAVELLQTAIDEYYQSPVANDARIQLAQVYQEELEYRMAWNELERALNNTTDKSQRGRVLLEQARTAEQLFSNERAGEIYQRILEEFDDTSLQNEARLQLGRLAILQKNYETAEEYLSELENNATGEYRLEALEYHGDLFWQQQAYTDARGYYMQGLNMDAPLETRQRLFLKSAMAAEELDDYSQAYQQLQTITDPDVTEDMNPDILRTAYDHMASAAEGIGRYREALAALNNLRSMSTANRAAIYQRIADIYLEHLSDYDTAVDYYNVLADSFPGYPHIDLAFLNQGKAYLQAGDIERSRQSFEQFIDEYPYSSYRQNAEAHLWYINHFRSPNQQQSFESLATVISDMLMDRESSQDISFKLGRIFFNEQQNYDASVAHFQNMLQQDLSQSTRDSSLWYLAESYRVISEGQGFLGNQDQQVFYMDRAVATYSELLNTLDPSSNLASRTVGRIGSLYLQEDPDEALTFLTQQRTSEEPALRLMVAEAYAATGKTVEAFSALQSLLSNENYATMYPEALAQAAALALKTGNESQAHDFYRRYLDQEPTGAYVPEAQWTLMQQAIAQEDYEEARNYAERLRQDAFYTDYLTQANDEIGQIYLETARYNDAAQWYAGLADAERRVQDLFIGESAMANAEPIYWAGYAFEAAGQTQKAMQHYRWYVYEGDDDQKLSDSYKFLANQAVEDENFSSAREFFLSAAYLLQDENPQQANEYRVDAAEMLFRLEEYDDAENEMFNLVENIQAPRKYEIWEQAITAQIRNNRISQANLQIEKLRAAANLSRNDEIMLKFDYEKARRLAASKQFQESVPMLREILDKNLSPEFELQVQYELASQLRVTNNHEEAIEMIGEIVSEHPESEVTPKALVTLGTIFAELERRSDAIDAFNRSLESGARGQTRKAAMSNLMALYDSGQLYDAAIAMAEQYMREFPDSEDLLSIRKQIGYYQMNNGEYEQAIQLFRGLQTEVDAELATEIQFYIGEAYFMQDKYKQAITEYLKVPYLSPPTQLPWSATALWKAGNAYEELGSIDRAVRLYERIIREEGAASNYGRFARKRINELTMQGNVTQ